jgi:hypothetical protein
MTISKTSAEVNLKVVHLVLGIAVLIIAIAANIWLAATWTAETEARITILEQREDNTGKLVKEILKLQRQQSIIIVEMKNNNIRLMRRQGLEYEELTDAHLLELVEDFPDGTE